MTIAGRGSRIIGGSIQSELTRDETLEIVRDGFFPRVSRTDEPDRTTKLGLQEFGLPFVSDPAIPKHLSASCRRHRAEAIGQGGHAPDERPARPDAILFNGGALTPTVVRDRVVEVVASWFSDDPGAPYSPRTFQRVARPGGRVWSSLLRGCARGGWHPDRRGDGPLVLRGLPVGNGRASLALRRPSRRSRGDEITIDNRDFDLLMGQPVAFPLASSSVRPDDKPGDLVATDPDSIRELPPLQSLMRVGRKAKAERVAVRLASRVTEVGTIELWCQSRTDDRRWRLQIQLRGPAGTPAPTGAVTGLENDRVVIEQSILDQAIEAIQVAFGPVAPSEELGPSRLLKRLEELLDSPRDQWPPRPCVRCRNRCATWPKLDSKVQGTSRAGTTWPDSASAPGRGSRSTRPGSRPSGPSSIKGSGIPRTSNVGPSGGSSGAGSRPGLSRAHHDEISRRLIPYLLPSKAAAGKKGDDLGPRPTSSQRCGAAASLERLTPDQKVTYGNILVKDQLPRPSLPHHLLWCLGRLGASRPALRARQHGRPSRNGRTLDSLLARSSDRPRPRNHRCHLRPGPACSGLGRPGTRPGRDRRASRFSNAWKSSEPTKSSADPRVSTTMLEAEQQGQALGDALPVGPRLLEGSEVGSA